MKPPKRFLDNPKDIQPEVEELVKEAEKEEIKQKEIAKEIEKVEVPQEQKTIIKLWIVVGILAGILCIQYIVTPISIGLKYTQENKENTDEITILREWTEEQTAKAKEERKTILCSKVTDQTKKCSGVKPIPTPTPTVKIVYPTQ